MTTAEPNGVDLGDRAVLEALVGDVDRFASAHWGRSPMWRNTGGSFGHLLSVERIEELLASGARRPTFRLVRNGATLPPEASTRPSRLGGRLVDDMADLARIATALHDGATLVLQGLQRTVVEVANFCRSLERATSHPAQANAYLTPTGGAGLAEHADGHDVFVVQLAGHKDWHVAGLGGLRLAEGDVLYLPRGTRHSATAAAAPSLHLTVGVLSVTYGAVLRRLIEDSAVDELRRPLPLGYADALGGAAFAEGLRSAKAAFTAELDGLDVEPVVERESLAAHRRRRPMGHGLLRSVLDLDTLGPRSVVVRRHDCPAHLSPAAEAGRRHLQLVDREMSFPAAMGPAIEVLLRGDPVVVDELPGLEPGNRLVLVRRLVREVVLEVVPAPQ